MYDEKTLEEMVKEELWREFLYQTESVKRLMSCGDYFEDFYEPIEVRENVCEVTRALIDAYNDPDISDGEFAIMSSGVDKRYYKFMLDRYNDPMEDSPITMYRRSHGLNNVVEQTAKQVLEYLETK